VRLQEIVIDMSGMTNSEHEKQVSDALMTVSGVQAVRVSYAEGRAVVSGDPEVATAGALSLAISGAGFVPGEVWFAE
jgi:copper chaperone CopZ